MDKFSFISKDILLLMALDLDTPDLLNLCLSSKIFNRKICQNDKFWLQKIRRDFPILINPDEPSNQDIDKYKRKTSYKKYYFWLLDLFISVPIENYNELLLISAETDKLDIFKILVYKYGIDPSFDNNNAFIQASHKGHYDIVKLLLQDKRVDPTDQHSLAIQGASSEGRRNVVILLLDDGRADPSANNNYAIRRASIRYYNIVKLLLGDDRIDPSVYDNVALRQAIINKRYDIALLLMLDSRVIKSLREEEVREFMEIINKNLSEEKIREAL